MRKLQTTVRALCAGAILATMAVSAAQAVGKQAWLDITPADANGTGGGTGGMNAHNSIAGYYSRTDGAWAGFLRKSDGTLSTFVPVDGGITVTTAINASDTIVGYSNNSRGETGYIRTADGTITLLNDLSSYVDPTAINDKGQVAGSYLFNNHWLGFIRDADGTIHSFASPDGSIMNVRAINKKGVTAGYYDDEAHAFIRSKYGKLTTFDVPGATNVEPFAVTTDNVVVGGWRNGTAYHGFIRHADGTIETFDVPGSQAGSTFPYAVNEDGIIVGQYSDTTSHTRGFARSPDGTYVTLNAPGGTRGTWIDHIAPDGKMVGHFFDTPNHTHIVRANKSLTGF